MKKLLISALAVLMTAAMFTGCGDDDTSTSSAAGNTNSTAASDSKAEEEESKADEEESKADEEESKADEEESKADEDEPAVAGPTAEEMEAAPYHAYFGIQSAPDYLFRDAWNNPSTGIGITNDKGVALFENLTYGNDFNTTFPTTWIDAAITGDGTYTVGTTDIDISDQTSLNLLFVSTDIAITPENSESLSITDVTLIVNGETVSTTDVYEVSYDETKSDDQYIQIDIINIYNPDLEPMDFDMSASDIQIQFTVAGLDA